MTRDSRRYRKIYPYYKTVPREIEQFSVVVDEEVLAVDWKPSVRTASSTNHALSGAGVSLSIGGVTVADEDRVLLKDQSDPVENGVYYFEADAKSGSYTLNRASDGRGGTLNCGATVYVEEGESSLTAWTLTTSNPVDVGTTPQTWTKKWYYLAVDPTWFFYSSTSGSLYTSGSVAFVGGGNEWGPVQSPSTKGSDVFFYVSGSFGGERALFGGDVVVSGSLLGKRNVVNTYSNIYVSGSVETGLGSRVVGISSHAEGLMTTASGSYSHSEGERTTAAGYASHAEGYLTTAAGSGSHAEGSGTLAVGRASHVEGRSSSGSGDYSHAEGQSTVTYGVASHSEGLQSIAWGDYSHAAGYTTLTSGSSSHAEGSGSVAFGSGSHAEGISSTASGAFSHAEGAFTVASGAYSHAEGISTTARGGDSHAEGSGSVSFGSGSHAEGRFTTAWGPTSHAEGSGSVSFGTGSHASGLGTVSSGSHTKAEGHTTVVVGAWSHVEGSGSATTSLGSGSHVEGLNSRVTNVHSHAEGQFTTGSGIASHAEGFRTTPSGRYSHAEGFFGTAQGRGSHVEGTVDGGGFASGDYSHSEGMSQESAGIYSHAEGFGYAGGVGSHGEGNEGYADGDYSRVSSTEVSYARGYASHAEGAWVEAQGAGSHAEGDGTAAAGIYSHSEGYLSVASGSYSHAEGIGTIASGSGQNIVGAYNVRGNADSLFIVGNGTGDANAQRSDMLRVNQISVQVTGSVVTSLGLSGSLTRLPDNRSYLVAGSNIGIVSSSNGSVSIGRFSDGFITISSSSIDTNPNISTEGTIDWFALSTSTAFPYQTATPSSVRSSKISGGWVASSFSWIHSNVSSFNLAIGTGGPTRSTTGSDSDAGGSLSNSSTYGYLERSSGTGVGWGYSFQVPVKAGKTWWIRVRGGHYTSNMTYTATLLDSYGATINSASLSAAGVAGDDNFEKITVLVTPNVDCDLLFRATVTSTLSDPFGGLPDANLSAVTISGSF